MHHMLQLNYLDDETEVIRGIIERRRQRRMPRERRCWVRPWLDVGRRLPFGQFHRLMPELRHEDPASFINYIRIQPQMFDELVQRITPRVTKRDTNYRKAIEPEMKIAIALRHLASGDNYSSMKFNFRVPQNTISLIVREVCQAIVDEFQDEVIKCPTTSEEWKAVAEQFEKRWNVPHAVGALDGKHIAIRKPNSSGSLYHNYKGFFSIVLLGMVDADYKFLWADTGGFGHMSDSQLFNESQLKECILDGSIGFPPADKLPNDDNDTPYFILGDDIFALRTYLMKPYSQRNMTVQKRIYNYRISRGRRVVENAFGILAQRWQILLSTMMHAPLNVRLLVDACICLHNLMRIRYPALQNAGIDREDDNHIIVPGAWRDVGMMHAIEMIKGATRATTAGKQQQEYLKHYFNSPAGSVPWQDDMI